MAACSGQSLYTIELHNPSLVVCVYVCVYFSTPDPGRHGFQVCFSKEAESSVRNSPLRFYQDSRTLVVRRAYDFAVTFKLDTPLPPNCLMRVLVSYKDPVQTRSHGPITRCLKHLAEEKGLYVHETTSMVTVGDCTPLKLECKLACKCTCLQLGY